MRRKLLASLAALAAGGGLAWAQTPPPRPVAKTQSVVPATPDMAGGVIPASLTAPPGSMGSGSAVATDPGLGAPMAGVPAGAVPPGAYALPGNGYPPPGYPAPGAGGFPGGYPGYPGAGHSCDPAAAYPPLEAYPTDGNCGGGPCDCCAPRVFGGVEYLLWWMRPAPIGTPLVTVGSPLGAGLEGQPTTRVVVGDKDVNFFQTSGIRASAGYWVDSNRRWGVELDGFLLEQRNRFFDFRSDQNGIPVIARPFTEAITGQPSSLLVSFPGLLSGGIDVSVRNRTYGAELNGLMNLYRSRPGHLYGLSADMIGGFRWMQVDEGLDITSVSDLLPGNTTPFAGILVGAPATIGVNDNFSTKNSFYGANVGGRVEFRKGRWTVSATAKVGIGDTHEILDINGASALIKQGFTTLAVQPGGLLAVASNINRSDKDVFAVLPEGTLNFGYQLTPGINLFCGYNILYLSRMVRPGDQLDPVVNGTLVPTSSLFGVPFGPNRPQPGIFNQDYFWAQGVQWGISIRF
jgi:hypothetical protein